MTQREADSGSVGGALMLIIGALRAPLIAWSSHRREKESCLSLRESLLA